MGASAWLRWGAACCVSGARSGRHGIRARDGRRESDCTAGSWQSRSSVSASPQITSHKICDPLRGSVRYPDRARRATHRLLQKRLRRVRERRRMQHDVRGVRLLRQPHRHILRAAPRRDRRRGGRWCAVVAGYYLYAAAIAGCCIIGGGCILERKAEYSSRSRGWDGVILYLGLFTGGGVFCVAMTVLGVAALVVSYM